MLQQLHTYFSTLICRDALEFNGVPWPPVSQEEAKSATPLKYMLLGNESKMINEPFEERVKFWESLRIPGLH